MTAVDAAIWAVLSEIVFVFFPFFTFCELSEVFLPQRTELFGIMCLNFGSLSFFLKDVGAAVQFDEAARVHISYRFICPVFEKPEIQRIVVFFPCRPPNM